MKRIGGRNHNIDHFDRLESVSSQRSDWGAWRDVDLNEGYGQYEQLFQEQMRAAGEQPELADTLDLAKQEAELATENIARYLSEPHRPLFWDTREALRMMRRELEGAIHLRLIAERQLAWERKRNQALCGCEA